ncbi:uncharacterized protein VTP21DRAFT_8910 [Calcarisporiella thermophila]|uniref:uncharacterized protein n=1 Tax=Calcarisporiella thermophila TaxID=911321 RepID=UPI00374376BC
MMKTTKSGRPFVKDIHDLFAALVVSLPLETNRRNFRSYPNTFTAEQAITNLNSLRFSQTNRAPDPKDPTRIVTTTVTTTFSMTKDMARSLCQHFLDAHLMESAVDKSNRNFKDKGIYGITPTGASILERFINNNNLAAAHLQALFGQIAAIKVLVLERKPDDDTLLLTPDTVRTIFKRFAGPAPNSSSSENGLGGGDELGSDSSSVMSTEVNRNLGIEVRDRTLFYTVYPNTFHGQAALDWLCEFTTVISRTEAATIASEFIRLSLVSQIVEKGEREDKAAGIVDSKSTLYQLTDEGQKIAGWLNEELPNGKNGDEVDLKEMLSYPASAATKKSGARLSRTDSSRLQKSRLIDFNLDAKESNAARLQQILKDAKLLPLFREFLQSNFCEENLAFLLECQEFKRKMAAVRSSGGGPEQKKEAASLAVKIFVTYLAPSSPSEVNIDHSLRQEMVQFFTAAGIVSLTTTSAPPTSTSATHQNNLATATTTTTTTTVTTTVTISEYSSITSGMLENITQMYDNARDHIFRLMSTDSVPKFMHPK